MGGCENWCYCNIHILNLKKHWEVLAQCTQLFRQRKYHIKVAYREVKSSMSLGGVQCVTILLTLRVILLTHRNTRRKKASECSTQSQPLHSVYDLWIECSARLYQKGESLKLLYVLESDKMSCRVCCHF